MKILKYIGILFIGVAIGSTFQCINMSKRVPENNPNPVYGTRDYSFMKDTTIEQGDMCLVWNEPMSGEEPRYNIRVYDHYVDSGKAKFVDDHNVYWDNAVALPSSIADRLKSFIKTLNE